IAVDKSEVKRGDNIAIFGQSVPNGEITVAISSEEEFFGKTAADQNGAYLYNFDTAELSMGQHFTKSKAARDGLISSFSKAVSFAVGTKNIAAELPKVAAKGDMNSDKRVNLVDFSIAAYWYKRPSPPATADLNGDGKVDLVDFSIMAFYWTG
ncbi:MAG: dockerin type I repeat-containing protein, partial [Patescibacteria group bacterium]